ncbi:NAD(P)H-dependent oxidoreductase [Methylobacillus gramineus]|uniref:FMN-dependent NADH-azoreductase n=1 Tax=Methylobacillus gramineus TaxID=755169 RepID=UPI001CFF54DD|nr:NAD(P)H-dependent oxidoreductase [Methylobacillus gramineus]MCB5183646.1 NAD(P)H-dependent oxidoreductase [Methylobacillus gramineus]
MRLMHVDASPKSNLSNSKMLSAYFVASLKKQIPELVVDYLDLSVDTPPHVTGEFAKATYTPAEERTEVMKQTLEYSDHLCARVLMSDILVFAMPMYNFSMPSSFKAFIDNLVRTNLTYNFNADGTTSGNLTRQKVLFITTRGADLRPGLSPWSHMDALTPALTSPFAFLGVESPWFVDAQPLQFSDQVAREEALKRAYDDLGAVASEWGRNIN